MKICVYAVREDERPSFEPYREAGAEYVFTQEYPSMENLSLAAGCEAVSVITNVLTPEMYEAWAAMGVKYLATRSVGYDHFDTAVMRRLGLRGVHASYSPNAVANYTIMLMLMACRKVNYILEKARLQDFSLAGKMGRELSLCTVGVVGAGQIGETVIRRLSGFGCRLLACDPCEKPAVKQYAAYVPLDVLLRESDIITLHMPGLAENRHLIDSAALAKMKDGVILVNTARGMLVDSCALLDALDSGKVGFAALDAFEEERGLYYKNLELARLDNRVWHVLTAHPNVLLSPHMAFYTRQSVDDMVGTTVRGLLAFAQGGENPAEISY